MPSSVVVARGLLAAAFAEADLQAAVLPPDRALPVASATDRRTWSRIAADAATLDPILTRAHTERETPWPQPLASAAARFHRDGDRETWESAAYERQRRLSRAVVAAAVSREDAWMDAVADGMTLLCEQSSWCWPAHDDSLTVHRAIVPVVDDPYLDLGAGEVVAQLAWADQVLGEHLDDRFPGLRERIRHEASVRVFDPFLRRRDWPWLGLDGPPSNWNPWIHGNVLVAALRLLDRPGDEETRIRVVALAIEGLDRYVASLPEDGAIDEGYGYWWEGACRALEALDVLAHATGGRLDGLGARIPALVNTVAFPHRMQLGGPWFVSVADGRARPPADLPWAALHRAARATGDADALAFAASHRIPGEPAATETAGLGRLLRAIADPVWVAAATDEPPLPRDVWLPSTQMLLAREQRGTAAGLTLVAKGGHNDEHHNHNDVGSFIVASDGVPVVVDAGRPTYTAQTFGPDRYGIWTMQSSWHSVPEVRGIPQSPGASFLARDGHRGDGELALDLAGAYDLPALRAWRRRIRLERGAHPRVVVEDVWDLDAWTGDAPEPETTVRLLLAGDVRLGSAAARVIPLDGAPPVDIRWPDDVAASLTMRELDDPTLMSSWGARLTRLDLVVTARRMVSVTIQLQESTPGDTDD